jgi:hypothetical protein
MDCFTSLLVGGIVGFVAGIVVTGSAYDSDTALKLANVMNASMLDCVTHKVITKEQVHDIEDVFSKHIEANFKHIKANHGDSCKEDKEE